MDPLDDRFPGVLREVKDGNPEDVLRLWCLHDSMRREEERRRSRLLLGASATAVVVVVVTCVVGLALFLDEPPATPRRAPALPSRAASDPSASTVTADLALLDSEDVTTPLTSPQMTSTQIARHRVQRIEEQATTPRARVALDERRAIAETWIRSMGYDRARIKARKTAHVFVLAAKAARAEKGVAQAVAMAIYWRDVHDLIVVAQAEAEDGGQAPPSRAPEVRITSTDSPR